MIRNIMMSTLLSLRAHKLRVFLTMVGIIIGIASVVTIAALGEGVKKESMQLADTTQANVMTIQHMMTMTDDGGMAYVEDQFTFNKSDMRRLSRLEGVQSVLPNYSANGWGGDSVDMNINYFGAESYAMMIPFKSESRILYGRDIRNDDANQDVIVLSHDVLDYGISLDDPATLIGQAVNINGYMFKVIGIKEPYNWESTSYGLESESYTWEDAMTSVVPQAAYNHLTRSKPIQSLKVKVADGYDRSLVSMTVIDDLMQQYIEDDGYFEEDRSNEQMMEEVTAYINGIMTFLMAITAISLFVGGIGVMNIMYVSVTERKREIGIRRAIGAKPRMIMLQFLLEAAFITFLGGVIGLLLGYGIAIIVGTIISLPVYLTPTMMLLSTSVSIGTGLIFGIIPALSASKMDPIKAIYQ
ncbi:ABC transporter permease [Jeotgalibaca arthritidis]|uniref:FtsX-like permease family protein n=1 Tax=Jeotgalibaca arthritidis TaxID=1868794 RepID=A0A6G7K7W6_9LACT|nr:FtsX-like permease family protein [Jeotgalibaca arthritidis]QII81354.1 FtsX-like permease family protein [Jeotgalibaca arthritidis]